ncbi:MAG: 23S rRNA (guanosine(2251)-2'-O)-methyltransferase RlmB [Flavobacteriales bacterium]
MKESGQQIYGIRPIIEAMLSGKIIDKLFLQQDLKSDQSKELLTLARDMGVSIVKAPKEKLNKLCRNNHQGAVAFASPIEFGSIEEIIQAVFEQSELPFFLMLDKVNDVRNFGSIARSALSAGCHAIIIPHKGSSAINEDAVKTSAGALYHIPVCKVHSLGDTIKMMNVSGITTIACSEKAERSIYDFDLTTPVNLLFGNEGNGIEPHLIRMAGKEAMIPMYGKVGSLNVAVATGICLFEAAKQRHSG